MADPSFTDRELEIMTVLWERGSGTVAEVRERLPDELAYTTVLTLMRILESKGHVQRQREGKAHRYTPVSGRSEAGRHALRRLMRTIFRGAPDLLVTQLVADEAVGEAELRRLRELVDARLADAAEDES